MSAKLPVSILVNNAGKMDPSRVFQLIPMGDMRTTFENNFFGTIALSQQLTRLMARNKRGSVINISSVAALDGDAHLDYSAAKAALIAATTKMARELFNMGIRVTCLCPGITDTMMVQDISQQVEEEMLGRVLMGRKARPEEIANVALFLASPLSSYMTGQTLRCDGGIL